MIESLFSYNLHNPNEESKSKSPSPSKHVLEPKRLQNLTILLKALNATSEQICRTLIQGKHPSQYITISGYLKMIIHFINNQ